MNWHSPRVREWAHAGRDGRAARNASLRPSSAEPPPETTRITHRTTRSASAWHPQYVAEELLQAEGFTEVQYVKNDRLNEATDQGACRGRGRHQPCTLRRTIHHASSIAGAPVVILGRSPHGLLRAVREPIRCARCGI